MPRAEITPPGDDASEYLTERQLSARKEPRWRSPAQRDHDRLLYSSAFQRLGGITQVTASELGRPFHTRLTHTLKVAQVARRSAERLKQMQVGGAAAEALVNSLDADATEAAALGHDLGHPPFGHLAETVLNERSMKAGGFEGNAQSFRVVTRLALRGPHPGLDLTRQTLNGLQKYPWFKSAEHPLKGRKWGAYSSDEEAFTWVRQHSTGEERTLEACLMDWADDITYAVHDVDDFSRAGLIPLDALAHDEDERVRFVARLADEERIPDAFNGPGDLVAALGQALSHVDLAGEYDGTVAQRVALRSFGSMLITRYIEALSLEDAGDDKAAVVIDDDAWRQVEALKSLTEGYVVRRPSLAVMQRGQTRLVESLWDWYFEATSPGGDIRLLPAAYRARLSDDNSEEGRIRLVTDLIAGMTENTALELYRRMAGVTSGSVLDSAARGST